MIVADINKINAETKMNTKDVGYLELKSEGTVKVRLGTDILSGLNEIDCEFPL